MQNSHDIPRQSDDTVVLHQNNARESTHIPIRMQIDDSSSEDSHDDRRPCVAGSSGSQTRVGSAFPAELASGIEMHQSATQSTSADQAIDDHNKHRYIPPPINPPEALEYPRPMERVEPPNIMAPGSVESQPPSSKTSARPTLSEVPFFSISLMKPRPKESGSGGASPDRASSIDLQTYQTNGAQSGLTDQEMGHRFRLNVQIRKRERFRRLLTAIIGGTFVVAPMVILHITNLEVEIVAG